MWKTSLSAILLSACAIAAERYTASEPHMGSMATITLYADNDEQAQGAFIKAFRRIAQLDSILSDYNPQSELSQVCEATASFSPDLLNVLRYAQTLAAETNGAFDITIGPLTQLWRQNRKQKRLPEDGQIEDARRRSGYQKLNLQNGVRCNVAGMRLDAGGIAKGYAADEALAAIQHAGVRSALVAMSGDIVIGDAPPGRPGWQVRVLDQVVTLANAAVSTSGDEFQYLLVDGKRYSHIIDPRTGMALRESRPVAVIANTGIEADAVATAVSVGGKDLGQRLASNRRVRILSQ